MANNSGAQAGKSNKIMVRRSQNQRASSEFNNTQTSKFYDAALLAQQNELNQMTIGSQN